MKIVICEKLQIDPAIVDGTYACLYQADRNTWCFKIVKIKDGNQVLHETDRISGGKSARSNIRRIFDSLRVHPGNLESVFLKLGDITLKEISETIEQYLNIDFTAEVAAALPRFPVPLD